MFQFDLKIIRITPLVLGCGFRPHGEAAQVRRSWQEGRSHPVRLLLRTPADRAGDGRGGNSMRLHSPIVDPGKIARMVNLVRDGGNRRRSAPGGRLVLGRPKRPTSRLMSLLQCRRWRSSSGILPGMPAKDVANRPKPPRARRASVFTTVGSQKRQQVSQAMTKAVECEPLTQGWPRRRIVSGGSTGTYNIDTAIPGVTELQVGSYVLHGRRSPPGSAESGAVYTDFKPSLTACHHGRDADAPPRLARCGGPKRSRPTPPYKPKWLAHLGAGRRWTARAFGSLTAEGGGKLPRLGDRLGLHSFPHCDPTVELLMMIYAVRGRLCGASRFAHLRPS